MTIKAVKQAADRWLVAENDARGVFEKAVEDLYEEARQAGQLERDGAVWAIVEVMGHRSYAGRVSEQRVAGKGFVRIEIPEVDGKGGAVKLLGAQSIFAFHLTTEQIAKAYVLRTPEQAIDVFARFGCQPAMALPPSDYEVEEDEEDEEDEEVPW